MLDGALYRPAQDCSVTYGGAVVINRIDRLTPEEFSEQPVSAWLQRLTALIHTDSTHSVAREM